MTLSTTPAPPQKRLLALDGGGVRGLLTIRVLARIEALLREQSARPDLVLADYFDYIGGTSTGALIAAGLSLGMETREIESFYVLQAPKLFAVTRNPLTRLLYSRYDPQPLETVLQEVFGADTTLGSARLKSLLMLVMLNAATTSPWPVSNNPAARYNNPALGDENNLNLKLWQLLRASTAAPYFFPPYPIQVGSRQYLFYDGALTTLNNPAFKLFQMATLPAYQLAWPTGAERLLLVSVGTGMIPREIQRLRLVDKQVGTTLLNTVQSLLFASGTEVDLQCRSLAHVIAGDPVDSEVGDLVGSPPAGGQPLFSYIRYNTLLTAAGLGALGCPELLQQTAFMIDDLDSLDACADVGDRLADARVQAGHFSGFPVPLSR